MRNERHTSALRRTVLRRLVLAGAAGSSMLTLLRDAIASSPESGMRNIKGEVHVDGKPATLGQKIQPGQTVTTGAGSEAVFVIGKDAFLQREASSFRIEREAGVVVLRYLSGKVLSVFGKGRKKLITPTATIGIRGTACYIEAEEARTYFCLCYGHAVLTPFADVARPRVLRTHHHERPLYIGMEKAAVMRAHVVNHRDAELVMLEALVGRKPPFYGKAKHY